MENFEQKYNEMVKRARELHEAGNALTKKQMEIVCPELAESEDESVREELLYYLKESAKGMTGIISTKKYAKWASWLEKQKEATDFGELMNKLSAKEQQIMFDAWEYDEKKAFEKQKEQKPVDELAIIKKHITDDFISSEVNDRLVKCGWKVVEEGEQKTSWSEEDEHCLELLDIIIDSSALIPKNRKKCHSFLKSLRPQQKEDNDEEKIGNFFDAIGDCGFSQAEILQLKTIWREIGLSKPQPHWKPSEEQMDALNYAIAEWDGGKKLEGLYSLRNELKKL